MLRPETRGCFLRVVTSRGVPGGQPLPRRSPRKAGLGIVAQACRASVPTPPPGAALSCPHLPACEPGLQGMARCRRHRPPWGATEPQMPSCSPPLQPGSYQDQDPSVAWGLGTWRQGQMERRIHKKPQTNKPCQKRRAQTDSGGLPGGSISW